MNSSTELRQLEGINYFIPPVNSKVNKNSAACRSSYHKVLRLSFPLPVKELLRKSLIKLMAAATIK